MIKKTINLHFKKSWFDFEDKKTISKKLFIFLILALIILSVGFWLFYYDQGLVLAYNDAKSRLNIARRIIDNLQPGFAQVGSVWLPLFHMLELPLIWNKTLWQSGIAGSVISMVSYVLGGVYLLKLLNKLEFSRIALLISFVIYALNPNMLYMQSLPLTEALLIFLAIAACYYLYSWSKDFKPSNLTLSAIFILLSSLTRYDGWFLLLFASIFVGIVSLIKKKIAFSIGNILMFLTLASLGVVLWLLWNKVIFGDPFYFALGPFSAKSQQLILKSQGLLFSKGNLIYSIFIYLVVVLYNAGIWIGSVALFGMVYFVFNKKIELNKKLILFLLSVPFIFNVSSLYAGHSVIHIPYIEPYTWFNDRYGLMMLPAIAVAFGYIVSKSKLCIILATSIIIFQFSFMYYGNNIITIEDGTRGSSGNFLDDAGNWLGANAKNGLILIASSSNDPLIFTSGIPLKRFIVEGSRRYWEDSLADPTRYAKWVVMMKGDLVEKNLNNNNKFLMNYSLVYKDAFSYIYVLDEKRVSPLSKDELP